MFLCFAHRAMHAINIRVNGTSLNSRALTIIQLKNLSEMEIEWNPLRECIIYLLNVLIFLKLSLHLIFHTAYAWCIRGKQTERNLIQLLVMTSLGAAQVILSPPP